VRLRKRTWGRVSWAWDYMSNLSLSLSSSRRKQWILILVSLSTTFAPQSALVYQRLPLWELAHMTGSSMDLIHVSTTGPHRSYWRDLIGFPRYFSRFPPPTFSLSPNGAGSRRLALLGETISTRSSTCAERTVSAACLPLIRLIGHTERSTTGGTHRCPGDSSRSAVYCCDLHKVHRCPLCSFQFPVWLSSSLQSRLNPNKQIEISILSV
jgi:hypothetical protein